MGCFCGSWLFIICFCYGWLNTFHDFLIRFWLFTQQVVPFTCCRVYLYCGKCESVFSINSSHRNGHKLYCCSIMICFACCKIGPTGQMFKDCGKHPQPTSCASRHEVNDSFLDLLREFSLRGRSMLLFVFNHLLCHSTWVLFCRWSDPFRHH